MFKSKNVPYNGAYQSDHYSPPPPSALSANTARQFFTNSKSASFASFSHAMNTTRLLSPPATTTMHLRPGSRGCPSILVLATTVSAATIFRTIYTITSAFAVPSLTPMMSSRASPFALH